MKKLFILGSSGRSQKLLFAALLFAVGAVCSTTRGETKTDTPSNSRVFCGSSPCDEPIRRLLGISTNGAKEIPELIEWKLTLHRDPKTRSPATYELRCDYGVTIPNKPGVGRSLAVIERRGKWSVNSGIDSNSRAQAIELEGGLSLRQIGPNVLHILNSDRTLMVGNGGWSYTLNSTEPAEATVDPELARTVPDMSYPIAPLSTGSTVFAVFEGRSPCLGIARQLKISVPASATKAKWRVTLYHDARSRAPTTYKIEGTLFRKAAREGNWRMVRGMPADSNATLYELGAALEQPAIQLLKGDDNVLFFLDEKRAPRVGHCEFSYTLNRVASRPAVAGN